MNAVEPQGLGPGRSAADVSSVRKSRRSGQPDRTAAQDIVAALALPVLPSASSDPILPLPLIGLGRISRDTSMLYGVGRVDASGRVTNREILRALGWRPGDRLEVVPGLAAIVIVASPDGFFAVPRKPCIVIPAAARRHHSINVGDYVLLAAAPDYGVVIVHTRQAMNEMFVRYCSACSPADGPSA